MNLQYDAMAGPSPEEWLQAAEAERSAAVKRWLEAAGVFGDEDELERRAALLATLETQIAGNDPPEVRQSLTRMVAAGLSRGLGLFGMAEVLDQTVRDMIEQDVEFDLADYTRRISALDAAQILGQMPINADPAAPFDPELQARLEAFAEAHADQGVVAFPTMAGFLFSVVCAPGALPPSAWLPQLLGKLSFSSRQQADDISTALMALNNWMADQVWSGAGDPLPADCRPDADALANLQKGSRFGQWCEGFARAQVSFEDLWLSAVSDDEERSLRLSQLFMNLSFFASEEMARELHAELSQGELTLSFEELAEGLCADVPQVLAEFIALGRELNEALRQRPRPAPARSIKVGRNETCPCGSGKKYKKCCGAPARGRQ